MWIFSTKGFVSIVEPNDRDFKDFGSTIEKKFTKQDRQASTIARPSTYLLVRARFDVDLNPFRGGDDLMMLDPGADYPYRVLAKRTDVESVMSKLISEIHYRNFKDACKRRERAVKREESENWLDALSQVWNYMWRAAAKFRPGCR